MQALCGAALVLSGGFLFSVAVQVAVWGAWGGAVLLGAAGAGVAVAGGLLWARGD